MKNEEFNGKVLAYQQMFDKLVDGFALYRIILGKENEAIDYEYIYFNSAYENLTGTRSSYLQGKTAMEVFNHVDKNLLNKYSSVAIDGQPARYEHFIESSQKYYSFSIFSPEKGYFAIIIRDITREKKAEINLRASEERFRELTENIDEVYWLWTKDRLLYVSPAVEKIWGFSSERFLTDPDSFWTTVHPDDKKKLDFEFSEIPKTGRFNGEFRIIRQDGGERWVWMRYFPVHNEKGEMYRYAGVVQDISERKIIEQELISAKEKAEESDRLKSAFLANMSHEIRTPMNGILGLAQALDKPDITPDERKEYIGLMNKSGKVLLNLINDIIDIAKIESGQITINPENFNVKQMLNDLASIFEAQKTIEGKENLRLGLIVPDTTDEMIIFSDRYRIRQVLTNLINNAIKFTSEGYVRFGFELKSDNQICFFVEDSGIGIPENEQKRIFERFNQVDYSNTRKYGGAGLGLAISNGIAILLGGFIDIKSTPDRGSTFRFCIPLCHSEEKNIENVYTVPDTGPVNWSKKRLLIVEDDDISCKVLELILRKTGVNIIRAKDGEEAFNIIENKDDFDLVLLDVNLPKIDGLEVLKKIKASRPGCPVILQTAHALNEQRDNFIKAADFDDYISKPIESGILLQKISRLLGSG